MAELNQANLTDAEWKSFIKDIVKVQDKHGVTLIPTLKFSPVTGVSVEWGGVRQKADVKTTIDNQTGEGSEVSKAEGS